MTLKKNKHIIKRWWKYIIIVAAPLIIYLSNCKSFTATISVLKIRQITEVTIILDETRILFSLVVIIITIMIALFSLSYIAHEKRKKRFTILMLLFVLSIIILVNSTNFITVIVGWDGLGLTSYCLVIYFQNFASLQRGLITILSNRIGDCFIVLAISTIITNITIKIDNNWILNNGLLKY